MSHEPMRRGVRAFLMYGLAGGPFPYGLGYSLGFDVMRDKLRAEGIDATTHVEGVIIPNSNVANLAAQAASAVERGNRLILVGHSMGANAGVRIARRLAQRRLSVDLLIGFDPTKYTCPKVPANVRRAICFYQKEFGDFLGRGRFTPAAKFTGECLNERVPYRHKKMDDAAELHARVLEEARALLPPATPGVER